MKLRYFIPMMAAVLTMMVSCSEDFEPTFLDAVRVSQSQVALPASGGSVEVTVNAKDAWTIADIPEWLTVTPAQGQAGETKVTFTAGATTDTKNGTIYINCGDKSQRINVMQVTKKTALPVSTCAEIIAGPDSKTYRAKGVVTRIANTVYGNWYLQDETGEVYIYGTLDKSGKDGQNNSIAAWGIEVGDILTVEGPKTTYNGTVELVNVEVISIEKSLIKVDSLDIANNTLPLEGGEFKASLTNKGNGVNVNIPSDAQSWLHVKGIDINGNATVVTFLADKNEGGDRSATINFTTTDGKKNYSSEATVTQKGAIVEVSVADFLAAEVGTTQYRITGAITELYASDKQGKSFYIQDFSGKTLVYRVEGFIEAGAKVGDIVTVVGQRGAYKDSPQLVSGNFEELKYAVTEVSIAEFLAKENSKTTYYMVTGTVKDLLSSDGKENDYGNLHITDGTNDLYVYGCYPGYGASGDARKGFVKAANIEVGDRLTMIGYKDTYKDVIELCGGIYFSHEKAE